jgi:hypothetical protein
MYITIRNHEVCHCYQQLYKNANYSHPVNAIHLNISPILDDWLFALHMIQVESINSHNPTNSFSHQLYTVLTN